MITPPPTSKAFSYEFKMPSLGNADAFVMKELYREVADWAVAIPQRLAFPLIFGDRPDETVGIETPWRDTTTMYYHGVLCECEACHFDPHTRGPFSIRETRMNTCKKCGISKRFFPSNQGWCYGCTFLPKTLHAEKETQQTQVEEVD